MTRRGVGRIVAASLLGALATPVTGVASRTLAIPRTLYARVVIQGGSVNVSVPVPLPFQATHLGFEWSEAARRPEFRSSADGVTWMPWRPLEASVDLSDPPAHRYFSDLISGRDARFVEVGAPGAGSDETAGAVVVTALNTRDGPLRRVRVAGSGGASAETPAPRIIRRAEWGADESMRKEAPTFARVKRLFVHHTATENDDPDPAGTLRAIYAYHTRSRGFDDIAYNFLIDSRGNIYEGRYARSYETREEPSSENENGMGVVGAHVAKNNAGSLGVALLGDFRSVPPPAEAVNALVDVLAWKADRDGVAPGGMGEDGLPGIAGHRDAVATECPGDRLYAQIPDLKERVEARIREMSALSAPAMPTGTELHPGSGSQDRTPGLTGATSRSAARVDVAFEGIGTGFRHVVSVTPRDGSFTVGDADFGPAALHPDRYVVRATAYDREGRSSAAAPVASGYVISPRVPIGYWVMGPDGTVLAYGSAEPYGSARDRGLDSPAVGLESTPTGKGYWLVASDGGVFSFGDAGFFGSAAAETLDEPVVGMAPTPTGKGYWLVASDGGVFSFGDAGFFGSAAAETLDEPVVGMAPTPTGKGYWLVASDGGVFSFGDAGFFGSAAAETLDEPVVGMAPTPTGKGYWLVTSQGKVLSFGDAKPYESPSGQQVPGSIVTMAATATGAGYYALSRGGGVHAFGDAPPHGSPEEAGVAIVAVDLALVP